MIHGGHGLLIHATHPSLNTRCLHLGALVQLLPVLPASGLHLGALVTCYLGSLLVVLLPVLPVLPVLPILPVLLVLPATA